MVFQVFHSQKGQIRNLELPSKIQIAVQKSWSNWPAGETERAEPGNTGIKKEDGYEDTRILIIGSLSQCNW